MAAPKWMRRSLERPLRALVRAVPPTATVRVLSGPLRGARWTAGASSAGCWLGHYEADVQRLMCSLVRSGDVVYDIGANAGFFTLLASRLVGPSGRVYAFEPMPENARVLHRHLELNRAANVEVIEAAVADRSGSLRFADGDRTAHADPHGSLLVRSVAIDELWGAGRLPAPQLVKLDVEGGELAAFRGMLALLGSVRPALLIEFHGAMIEGVDSDTVCREMLVEQGYELTRAECGEVIAVPQSRRGVRVPSGSFPAGRSAPLQEGS